MKRELPAYPGYRWFDRITELATGQRASAFKSVSPDEKFFPDHFPRLPIVPGMLQMEGLIQLGSWLISAGSDFRCAAMPRSAGGVEFRKYVRPGALMILRAEIASLEADSAVVRASATVDGKTVARVREIAFEYVPLSPGRIAREKARFNLLSGQEAKWMRPNG